jgi:uncharacterized repeat protein (TIGR01451 family)
LGIGESAALDLKVTVIDTSELINTACTVAGIQRDPDSTNNSASAFVNQDTMNYAAILDLAVQKRVNREKVQAGDQVFFTVILRNLGPDEATGIQVTDLLPTGLHLLSATASQGSYDGVTGSWWIGSLPVGQYCMLSVMAEVAGSSGNMTNTASVHHLEEFDVFAGNNADSAVVSIAALPVKIDIKPGSCPNPIELKSNGVLPAAILGTAELRVEGIDPQTVRVGREGLTGVEVAPIRWEYEDVATPFEGSICGCHNLRSDGHTDLTLKLDRQELVKKLKLGEVAGKTVPLKFTGKLYDGTPITGSDCVRVQ